MSSIAVATASSRTTGPRPPTSWLAPSAATWSSVVVDQSATWASPMYGAACASTRSPAKQMPSSGSHTTRSPDGVAAPEVAQLDPPVAEVERELVVERHRRMRETGNRLGTEEEARHAALLARPVLLAALVDQGLRVGVGDDPPRVEGRCAERPHGVVVGQHEVAEGEVADLGADDVDPSLGHHRRGARLDGEDRIGPDDAADVRVALRGEGEDAIGQLARGWPPSRPGRPRRRTASASRR